MAKDIETLSGVDLTDFQTVMLNTVGSYLHSSGSAPSPVSSFIIPIPTTGDAFRLEMRGVRMSVAGNLGGVFSFDGGITYYYTGALDTYADKIMTIPSEMVQAFDMTMQIRPGGGGGSPTDLARLAFINWCSIYPQGFSSKVDQDGLNPSAVTPPPTTRATHVQFFPYGNDNFPPTSGQTITCDNWLIFRLK